MPERHDRDRYGVLDPGGDLDLQFGDVALCLGLGPERTFYDLAQAGGTLDAQKVDAYMMAHPSGVRVLLAPTRPDQASSITVELIRDVYSTLRTEYDAVIVDTPPGFTAEVIATIDAATDLVVVGMLDALSLKNTKLMLASRNVQTTKVVNSYGVNIYDLVNHQKVVLTPKTVEELVGILQPRAKDDEEAEYEARRQDGDDRGRRMPGNRGAAA